MTIQYTIEDEKHAELSGQFSTLEEAVNELRKRAELPWDELPNVAPCTNWKKCGRDYEIIEYDVSTVPCTTVRRIPALSVSAEGIQWDSKLPH